MAAYERPTSPGGVITLASQLKLQVQTGTPEPVPKPVLA